MGLGELWLVGIVYTRLRLHLVTLTRSLSLTRYTPGYAGLPAPSAPPPHGSGRPAAGQGSRLHRLYQASHNFVGENRDHELYSIVVIQTRYLVAVNIFYEFCQGISSVLDPVWSVDSTPARSSATGIHHSSQEYLLTNILRGQ